jgi:predicted ATPase
VALFSLHIPRTVQDAVQQRTMQLCAASQQTLTVAAVAGQHFDFAVLQAVTGYTEAELLVQIKELLAAQLVVEASAERFAFRHAPTRQAVCSQLLTREKKALHRQIAEAIEYLYVSSLESYAADLAYHYYEAGTWEKALAYAHRAGEQAQALYTPRAAIEQFTRARGCPTLGTNCHDGWVYRPTQRRFPVPWRSLRIVFGSHPSSLAQ